MNNYRVSHNYLQFVSYNYFKKIPQIFFVESLINKTNLYFGKGSRNTHIQYVLTSALIDTFQVYIFVRSVSMRKPFHDVLNICEFVCVCIVPF